mmetsp:Transcript_32056/g.44711  ORF Transcript_32056/g.44711 Transcript_32056/m.44711 type:complete len:156 (-) Transcript_32056:4735-5202(-)
MVCTQLLKKQYLWHSNRPKTLFNRKNNFTNLKIKNFNNKIPKIIQIPQKFSSITRSSLFFTIPDFTPMTILEKYVSFDFMKILQDLYPYLIYYLSAFYRLIIMFIYRMLTLSYCIILTRNYWLYLVEVREAHSSSWKKKKKSNPFLVVKLLFKAC